jgi:hypothetical protein
MGVFSTLKLLLWDSIFEIAILDIENGCVLRVVILFSVDSTGWVKPRYVMN